MPNEPIRELSRDERLSVYLAAFSYFIANPPKTFPPDAQGNKKPATDPLFVAAVWAHRSLSSVESVFRSDAEYRAKGGAAASSKEGRDASSY